MQYKQGSYVVWMKISFIMKHNVEKNVYAQKRKQVLYQKFHLTLYKSFIFMYI